MRLIAISILFLLIGCKKEEVKETTINTTVQNCNCNRVISHTTFNLTTGQFGEYVTINDCTGVQVNGSWSTNQGQVEPVNGTCY